MSSRTALEGPTRSAAARLRGVVSALLLAVAAAGAVRAEPYLAVHAGLRCAQCHVNQTGGGMRTPFGNAFALTQLAARRLDSTSAWSGRVAQWSEEGPLPGGWLRVGANLRAATVATEAGGVRESQSLRTREARIYADFTPIAERLTLYVDQFVAPGASLNREAVVLYRAADGSHYLKAGRFYLPFGWRLQDNSAFVRTETAIDMIGPDRGVEVGWDHGAWSAQFALSNGTFGKAEVDSGKQYSLQVARIDGDWRVGAAGNVNDRAIGARSAAGLFAGLRSGPIAWLAEVAAVEDRSSGGRRRSFAWLAEGNWRFALGHNLKLSAEGVDPDRRRSGDGQTRLSAVYELAPLPFVQLRGGARRHDGPSGVPSSNRRVVFVELHGFF